MEPTTANPPDRRDATARAKAKAGRPKVAGRADEHLETITACCSRSSSNPPPSCLSPPVAAALLTTPGGTVQGIRQAGPIKVAAAAPMSSQRLAA